MTRSGKLASEGGRDVGANLVQVRSTDSLRQAAGPGGADSRAEGRAAATESPPGLPG
jgi:hypothetical protein